MPNWIEGTLKLRGNVNGVEPAGLYYCGKCFGPIRSRDKYCPNCGILIKRDEEG